MTTSASVNGGAAPSPCGPNGDSGEAQRKASGAADAATGAKAPGGSRKRRLSPLDAAFIYLERPNQLVHVGCIAELDGPVAPSDLVRVIEERLIILERYRQRPVRAMLDLDWPSWEDDPAFDVRRHVRHMAAPPPGDAAALHELIDQLFSTPLDPNHPLWEAYLIDGLADGRSAMLWKIHHCMIDGVSGAQVLNLITDPAPGSAARACAPNLPRSAQMAASARDTAAAGGSWLAAALTRAVSRMLGSVDVAALARDVVEAVNVVRSIALAPSTVLPFNRRLSDRRHVVWSTFPLDDLLAIRGAAGCKVNDVVLAIICSAVHRYLEANAFPTGDTRFRAAVPVSVRGEGDRLTLGNLVTAVIPTLPIGPLAPAERLRLIAAEMDGIKRRGQARALGLTLSLAGFVPAPVEAALARFAPDVPVFNTVCTNIPGPPEARLLCDVPIAAVHPFMPLFQSMGLEFAIMSYAGQISIGVTADATLVPDAERVATALGEAEAELRDAFPATLQAADASRAVERLPAAPRVADLMTRDVETLAPTDSLLFAFRVMRRLRIRHLPVVDAERRVIGIVTHRDLLAAQASSLGLRSEEARIHVLASCAAGDVMETHLSMASPDEAAAEAGRRMMRHKIGCLPVVVGDGRLVGIVTEEDFLRWATDHMGQGEAGLGVGGANLGTAERPLPDAARAPARGLAASAGGS